MGNIASFGELLKIYRINLNCSQRRLARLAKMDSSHISRVENGKKNPPKRKTIAKIALALNLNENEYGALYKSAGYLSPEALGAEVDTRDYSSPEVNFLKEGVGKMLYTERDIKKALKLEKLVGLENLILERLRILKNERLKNIL